jgi:hypothetical protein
MFFFGALFAAAQPQSQPTVSLVALDREGQNVLDLKSDELQVLDDGHKQQITSFGRPEKAPASPAVILFDLMNTATGARGNVPEQIVKSRQAVAPGASVSLYLLAGDGTLHTVNGLNASDLDDALRNVQLLRTANLDATGARVRATYSALAELPRR